MTEEFATPSRSGDLPQETGSRDVSEHSSEDERAIESTSDELLAWLMPPESAGELVTTGPYKGRQLIDQPGAVLDIAPSVRSTLKGPHRPDSLVDAGAVSSGLELGAVSIRGAGHHYSGAPRQDAYSLQVSGDWIIAAIADGVSAGRLSHLGADAAVETAIVETRRQLEIAGKLAELDWQAVGEALRRAVRQLGIQMAVRSPRGNAEYASGQHPSDHTIAGIVGTTCDVLIAPARQNRTDSYEFAWCRVAGDSSCLILDPQQGWLSLGQGKDTQSAQIENSVIALPQAGGLPEVHVQELKPGQAVVLCTDGFGDVIGRGGTPVGSYIFDAWSEPLDTVGLLSTASFLHRNADDDRTALILWRG